MTDIEQLLESQIAAGTALGAAVMLVRDGRVCLSVQAGQAEAGSALADDSIFLWLSSGKPLTAIAVARLYEQGLVRLDDRVSAYLPAFAANGKQSITIRHLLTHRAGLHKALAGTWDAGDWGSVIDRVRQASLPAGFVVGQTAAYDPGASWFILGEIIQRVTGKAFGEVMRERIFAPCGMADAAFAYTAGEFERLRPRLVQYFNTAAGEAHPMRCNDWPAVATPRPGASLRATMREMVGFYQGLLDGKLIRRETLNLFTSAQRGRVKDLTFGGSLDWGLGIMPYNGPDVPYSFGRHVSGAAFGHGGQQSSVVFCDPQRNLVFAAAYNGLCGERAHHRRMADLIEAVFATAQAVPGSDTTRA